MKEFINLDGSALFEEIVSRGREQGIADQEAYDELVKETIEDRRSLGEIHDDSPTEDMAEQLRGRWADFKEALDL